ncbi:MAG: hypothetical protein E7031_02795 [Akkermansiaceae bacterium]|nr:hypothetical protein [Akkermansiaceae bacterium]
MKRYNRLTAALGIILSITACQQQAQLPYLPQEVARLNILTEKMETMLEYAPDEPQAYPMNTYEHFVCHHAYPRTMSIFHDDELISRANQENAHIVISLFHQRGRLYVEDKVAADWPVSTGVEGRATTPGEYKVLEKKKDHASGRFGSILDSNGNTLVSDADSRTHTVPEGGKWVGSPMPNWMRLTDYGMGMHTGIVSPGTRLSHGCIRMPEYMAFRLFYLVEVGFPVTVTSELEEEYPANEALLAGAAYNSWLYEKKQLEDEIKKINKAAEKRLNTPQPEAATPTTPPEQPAESPTAAS